MEYIYLGITILAAMTANKLLDKAVQNLSSYITEQISKYKIKRKRNNRKKILKEQEEAAKLVKEAMNL
jgi:ribonuclease HI